MEGCARTKVAKPSQLLRLQQARQGLNTRMTEGTSTMGGDRILVGPMPSREKQTQSRLATENSIFDNLQSNEQLCQSAAPCHSRIKSTNQVNSHEDPSMMCSTQKDSQFLATSAAFFEPHTCMDATFSSEMDPTPYTRESRLLDSEGRNSQMQNKSQGSRQSPSCNSGAVQLGKKGTPVGFGSQYSSTVKTMTPFQRRTKKSLANEVATSLFEQSPQEMVMELSPSKEHDSVLSRRQVNQGQYRPAHLPSTKRRLQEFKLAYDLKELEMNKIAKNRGVVHPRASSLPGTMGKQVGEKERRKLTSFIRNFIGEKNCDIFL